MVYNMIGAHKRIVTMVIYDVSDGNSFLMQHTALSLSIIHLTIFFAKACESVALSSPHRWRRARHKERRNNMLIEQ